MQYMQHVFVYVCLCVAHVTRTQNNEITHDGEERLCMYRYVVQHRWVEYVA